MDEFPDSEKLLVSYFGLDEIVIFGGFEKLQNDEISMGGCHIFDTKKNTIRKVF